MCINLWKTPPLAVEKPVENFAAKRVLQHPFLRYCHVGLKGFSLCVSLRSEGLISNVKEPQRNEDEDAEKRREFLQRRAYLS